MQNSNFRAVSPNVTDGGPQGKKENQEKVTSPTMSPNSEKNLTEAEIQVIHYSKNLKSVKKGLDLVQVSCLFGRTLATEQIKTTKKWREISK